MRKNNTKKKKMSKALLTTDFQFENQKETYHGKVRDTYTIGDELLIMVVTDRISAFDAILPWGIPHKGQVLNQIAAHFLDATADIVPNWKLATPDPMVTVGWRCDPYPIEMVIRGYLSGHAWREYSAGKRCICGEKLPEGLKENDRLPFPIITPTTKASEGHDEDISKEEIIRQGLVPAAEYEMLEKYTKALYQRGVQMAQQQGLILVDTKYEFGKRNGEITLIDEIHTPDSSRYFYLEGYSSRQMNGEPQKQLSKEFVRQWLMESGFKGEKGDTPPALTQKKEQEVTQRYIELYEKIAGQPFEPATGKEVAKRIFQNVNAWLTKRL